MTWRHLELTPQRLGRWWDKFHADHPGVSWRITSHGVELSSTDLTVARFRGWYPITDHDDPLSGLTAAPATVGIILVRRGGYSVALARRGQPGWQLVDHKTGTRYVQSKTAAGGWSQQRFARRRENQAGELIGVVQHHTRRILAPVLTGAVGDCGLITGGDNNLVRRVLSAGEFAALGDLPLREFPDIPDPRFGILQDVVRRAGMVRLAVRNP